MKHTSTKASILSGLTRLWILDRPVLRDLEAAVQTASEKDLAKIADAVHAALQKQDTLLQKLVKDDPKLPEKLRQFLHEQVRGTQGEIASRESQTLEELTQEIDRQ